MKFSRIDLLTLLISLFILNSCKNQDTVGLGVNSTSQLNGNLVDTSTVVVNTVREDSVVTTSLAKNPLANFTDPIFGLTEANLALSVSLPGKAAYTLPSGTITIDSARLIMPFADGFYGDSISSNYKVNLYQLKTFFNDNQVYYSTSVWDKQPTVLGTLSFRSRTHDSISVTRIVSGKPDTIVKVPSQLRIPVSSAFILNNFFNASSATLASNNVFQNSLKGLYLTIDKSGSTGPGGIFVFKSTDTLAVYCKVTNNGVIDTTQILLPITGLSSSITHTYPDAIKNELNKTTPSNVFYLQGLAGLRTKISFPNLLVNLRKKLADQNKDIVLNRAELIITPNPAAGIPYRPLPRLTMYKLDIAHQRTSVQDAVTSDPRSGGVAVFGGYYSSTKKSYSFIITAFLQDLLLNKTQDYGTYMAPADTTDKSTVATATIPQASARTMAIGLDNNSAYKIKLNIIYTEVNK